MPQRKQSTNPDNGAELLISAAQLHGENNDPQDQISDLEGIVRAAWKIMDNSQRLLLISDPEVNEQYELDGDMDELEVLGKALAAK